MIRTSPSSLVPLAVLVVAAGWTLACAGLTEDLGLTDAVEGETDAEEESEEDPADVEDSPLRLDVGYFFDKDEAAKPEWDLDLTLTFDAEMNCTLLFESTYTCLYDIREEDGTWTVSITEFVDAKDPDGNPHEVGELDLGTYVIGEDGATLTEDNGRVFAMIEDGDPPEEDEADEADPPPAPAPSGGARGGKSRKGGKGSKTKKGIKRGEG